MDGRSADGSSIESDRSGYFPDQASGKFSEPKSQEKSETSIFTRNRWNANGGFATRRRIDINNVNNMPICQYANEPICQCPTARPDMAAQPIGTLAY